MTTKENYLRAVKFETPDYIPMEFHINDACYNHYDNDCLLELVEKHAALFPNFKPSKGYKPSYANCSKKHEPYLDDFSCLWETTEDGIVGTVTKHPLKSWDDFDGYKAPDPSKCMGIGTIDWDAEEAKIISSPDKLHIGGLRHGHTFLQLCDIRGYENLTFDMTDDDERLYKLIELVEEFNMYIVKKYIEYKVDVMIYAEDLGMQLGPMISPQHFKKYIKPSYSRLIKPAKDADILIHMHSDGDIRTLVDDLTEVGVDIVNLQDCVNGLDWIAQKFRDKTCVDLDIDRQNITLFGTQKDIENHIRESVTKIGSKRGGLTMIYGLYPGVPFENVGYIMDAMERYMSFYN